VGSEVVAATGNGAPAAGAEGSEAAAVAGSGQRQRAAVMAMDHLLARGEGARTSYRLPQRLDLVAAARCSVEHVTLAAAVVEGACA
jgi:hypothetical protein